MANFSQTKENQLASPKQSLAHLLDSANVRGRFEKILGNKANGFISSVLNTVNSTPALQKVSSENPQSILRSAAVAAALDLPIDKNLGFAHIVPYKEEAQFQMGYKGYIQLAMRTGQYKTINATEIYEGELVSRNRLTGEITFDESQKKSDKIIGYAAYFRLSNGFEKTLFMTIEELRAHGKRYSKSYNKEFSIWKQNENAMCLKTVLKLILSKYGILSIDMQTAIKADQAVVKSDDLDDGNAFDYVDGTDGVETIEAEIITKEGNN